MYKPNRRECLKGTEVLNICLCNCSTWTLRFVYCLKQPLRTLQIHHVHIQWIFCFYSVDLVFLYFKIKYLSYRISTFPQEMSVFALSPLNSYQMQFRRFKAYKYDFFNTGHYHIHYQSWFLIAEHRSVYFAHLFCFYSWSFYIFFLAPQNLVLFLNHSTTIRRGLWDFDWGTVVTLALSIPVSICLFFLKNI